MTNVIPTKETKLQDQIKRHCRIKIQRIQKSFQLNQKILALIDCNFSYFYIEINRELTSDQSEQESVLITNLNLKA